MGRKVDRLDFLFMLVAFTVVVLGTIEIVSATTVVVVIILCALGVIYD